MIFYMNESTQIDISKTLDQILALPAKKRLDAIIDHARPIELVRALSAHDILLTLRDIGAEDALELVELLSPPQVQHLLDLEIWESDQINPAKAGSYFSLLFAANDERAVSQIHGLDIELVGLMFKMVAWIYDTSIGEEPEDYPDICSTSPGGRFIICFDDSHEKRALSQSLYAFIESLYSRDMKVALGLLEDIRFEMASGLEGASLRFRQHRLLDMGILPREERLGFFATIRAGDLKLADTVPPIRAFDSAQCHLPTRKFIDHMDKRYPFLWQAINDGSHEEQSYYLDYLAHASINMHASLLDDFGDADLIKLSVAYAKTLAELGLVQATKGQVDLAYKVLRNNSIKDLIRLGRTSLVNLRKVLLSLTKDESYLLGENFSLLDSPLREVARALVLGEPRFYEGLLDPKKLGLRFFSSLSDLNAAIMAINEIKFRALLNGPTILGCTQAMLTEHKDLGHGNIYGRYLVNRFFKHENPLANIAPREILSIFGTENRLNDDFTAFAKNLSEELAHKLAEQDYYDLPKALELSHNFSTTVLIQMEQNNRLLLG
jgi:hypothetical protein